MKVAKLVALIGLVAMTAVLIYGFTVGDFFADGRLILQNPWGIVSLVDLYVGFALFSLWIVYREQSKSVAAVWVLLMMTLGFFTASLYTLIALYNCDEDALVFFLGRQKAAHYKYSP